MSAEAIAVLWGVAVLVAWSGCCWSLGAIWEYKRQQRADLNERDAWAERYQQEHKGAA